MSIKVTSSNRTAAKRLLNTWYDSRAVRVMTLDALTSTLQRAINEDLITEVGARRALEPQSHRQDNSDDHGNGERHEDERDHSNDDERDDNAGGDGSDSGKDSEGADGEGEGEQENKGEQEQGSQEQESDDNSKGESDEQSNDKSDGESESDNDDDGEDKQSDSDDDGAESDDDEQSEGESDSESEGEGDDDQESQSNDDDEQDDDKPLRHEMFPVVLKWIKAGVNVALVGPAGTGKSTIVGHVAEELEREFRGCGALMSKYDLVGYNDAGGTYHSTPLYEAFTEGHLFCFDELDGSAPDAVVAFNAATDNQDVFAFPNGMQPKHDEFVAVACMNTWGNGASADYVGRYKQDAASMSRFVKVYIGYDRNIEKVIGGKHQDIVQRVWDLRESCESLGIRHVVSTRMIQQAAAGRSVRCTKKEIDRDVLFAGLDDGAIKQIKTSMNRLVAARKTS